MITLAVVGVRETLRAERVEPEAEVLEVPAVEETQFLGRQTRAAEAEALQLEHLALVVPVLLS